MATMSQIADKVDLVFVKCQTNNMTMSEMKQRVSLLGVDDKNLYQKLRHIATEWVGYRHESLDGKCYIVRD